MKIYNYKTIDEHIQWLMQMMDIEYPNNYELVINRNYAEIRNKQTELNFTPKYEYKNNKGDAEEK